jgi:hypothetical protein
MFGCTRTLPSTEMGKGRVVHDLHCSGIKGANGIVMAMLKMLNSTLFKFHLQCSDSSVDFAGKLCGKENGTNRQSYLQKLVFSTTTQNMNLLSCSLLQQRLHNLPTRRKYIWSIYYIIHLSLFRIIQIINGRYCSHNLQYINN